MKIVDDSQTIDEASLYFQDPDMEQPDRRRLLPWDSPSVKLTKTPWKAVAGSYSNYEGGASTRSGDGFPSSSSARCAVINSPLHKRSSFWEYQSDLWCDESSLDYSRDGDSEIADDFNESQATIIWDLEPHSSRPCKERYECFRLPWDWLSSLFQKDG